MTARRRAGWVKVTRVPVEPRPEQGLALRQRVADLGEERAATMEADFYYYKAPGTNRRPESE